MDPAGHQGGGCTYQVSACAFRAPVSPSVGPPPQPTSPLKNPAAVAALKTKLSVTKDLKIDAPVEIQWKSQVNGDREKQLVLPHDPNVLHTYNLLVCAAVTGAESLRSACRQFCSNRPRAAAVATCGSL